MEKFLRTYDSKKTRFNIYKQITTFRKLQMYYINNICCYILSAKFKFLIILKQPWDRQKGR